MILRDLLFPRSSIVAARNIITHTFPGRRPLPGQETSLVGASHNQTETNYRRFTGWWNDILFGRIFFRIIIEMLASRLMYEENLHV